MNSNISPLLWERQLYGHTIRLKNTTNEWRGLSNIEHGLQFDMEQSLELSKLKSITNSSSNSTITSMSIDTSDQKYLLVGGLDRTISIYDIDANINLQDCKIEPVAIAPMVTIPKESTHEFMISCVQWYPHDTGMFFSGSYDQMLKIWDTNTLQMVTQFRFPDKLLHFHASPCASKQQLIAGASKHSTIRLCDLTSGAFTHSLIGHRDGIYDVKFSPSDEHILYSASSDHTIRVWDLRKSGYLFCFNQSNTFYNRKEDATNNKFSTKKLHPNAPVVTAHNGAVNAIQVTPDGQYLLSTGNDNAMRLWNTKTGMNTLINYPNIVNPHRKTIEFDISSDGRVIYFPNEGDIYVYETFTGKMLQKLVGHYNMVNSVRYYAKESELYSASNDNKVFVWSPKRCHAALEETLSFTRNGNNGDTLALLQDNWSDDEA